MNLIILEVYAQAFDAAEETKDSFNDVLQGGVGRISTGDMLIVTGDSNAKPGPVATATRHILGKFGVGTMSANGDHLVTFASTNRLVVSSTCF